ncbi:MAG: multicopper oxidase domain-containing protein, partial [Candidatus Tectomicrobia bacterium]|nr:multicopper oxidase domain-containing protein [Candidatus Tectomicrobia bacterium]
SKLVWSFPGPTYEIYKSSAPRKRDGTRVHLDLYNRLPKDEPTATGCSDYTAANNGRDIYPNCFHNNNNTNIHYHGFHVSPQPPQDDVLIAVEPGHDFDFRIDPIPWTQAEGTHWYHPHNHGSTALQVINGMAGTFLIRGPFDRWLHQAYEKQLTEKVMVIQQVQPSLTLLDSAVSGNPNPLVNGQGDPVVTLRPGEVQWWRMVAATMNANSHLAIIFPKELIVKQIAMDGVRFAPENYVSQPLLEGEHLNQDYTITLSPGNRADFLVQSPIPKTLEPLAQQDYKVTHRIVGQIAPAVQELVRKRRAKATTEQEAEQQVYQLFTVRVEGAAQSMKNPADLTLPPMPKFLRDIPEPKDKRDVVYQMEGSRNREMPPKFFINNVQYVRNCASQTFTVTLGSSVQWTLKNESDQGTTNLIQHPFHIHINPFQVVEYDGDTKSPPYVWQDTIGLANNSTGNVVLYQKFINFTGGFVQHCHILGHEDRGMMTNVQTVCKNGKFGKPGDGVKPECRPGNYEPAFPLCPSAAILANLQKEGGAEWLSLCIPPTYRGSAEDYLTRFAPKMKTQ